MTGTKKINCWEYVECGREEGGRNTKQLGVCPASLNSKELGPLQGIHDGIHGGRCCWVIAGTLCQGEIQGTYAKKYDSCTKCEFFKLVKQEEGKWFMLSANLLALINKEQEVEIFAD